MEPQKRIISEPTYQIRKSAREAMKGHMFMLFISAALYMLCFFVPIVVVEQITGLWQIVENALVSYMDLISNFSFVALNEWAETYSVGMSFSFATFLFVLFIPGPLTLGISQIWLFVIRRKKAYADMIFSGFGDFFRVVAMDTLRRVLILLWSILLIIPGIIANYRYSLAFFLLADNPEMKGIQAINYSKYYMQNNKGNRFFLDVSFIGWFAVSAIAFYFVSGIVSAIVLNGGSDGLVFTQFLVSAIVGSFVFAPVCAYRGVAAAEYYHRVICKNPLD